MYNITLLDENDTTKKANVEVLQMMSNYLNHAPDFIKAETVEEICDTCYVTEEYAFAVLLAAACGLEIDERPWDERLFHQYFLPMVHHLNVHEYEKNPYYQNIHVPTVGHRGFELKQESFQPYEAFVCNDMERTEDGKLLPPIGFFSSEFRFPAILEQGRIWMTVTPNEIETMKTPIERAHGNVLTFGLGLGYYAYMVSQKSEVDHVTIVDCSEEIISLFTTYLLPQFPNKEKINIIHSDAFEYAKTHYACTTYDYVFTDLWHDVSDGMELYLKMKEFEPLNPNAEYDYWIETSIRCYL